MSSLFGFPQPVPNPFLTTSSAASTSQPAPTGGLFGQSTTQAGQSGGLFGNLKTTQPAQTGGLFGSLGTSQPAPTGGLFGGLGTSQPARTGGLFGGSTTQPAQTAQTGSLFGGVAASQPAQTGGVFGSLGTSQPAQQANSFAAPPIGGSTQSGLLGIKASSQQNGQPAQADNGLRSAYFNTLLEKNKKRSRAVDEDSGFGEVPSLQLGLGDIAKKVRQLGGVGLQDQGKGGSDTRAHYLLAASGINPGSTLRDIHAFNDRTSSPAFLPPQPEWDPDSHKYVEQLQQQSTLKMISDGISRAQRSFDAYLEENVDINWEEQRKKIYEHFGFTPKGGANLDSANLSSPGGKGSFGKSTRRGLGADGSRQGTPNRSVFGRSGMQKSVIGTPGVGGENGSVFRDVAEKSTQAPATQDDRYQRERQAKFAEKVQRLNEARLQEKFFPIMKEFSEVEGKPGGDSPSHLLESYKALAETLGEYPEVKQLTDPRALQEREYWTGYADENPNSTKSVSMKKMILRGSRKALEKQFFRQVESVVARNPREASLGGVPTIINKVRAYIRLRDLRKDLAPDGIELQKVNDDYCWALIFFLIRSGFITEAAEYVTSNSTAFRALDRNFVTYITLYTQNEERKLPIRQQTQINTDYQQRTRTAPENSLDPYRMACFKIIGRCELGRRSFDGISQGVEDWMWLQFCLAREINRAEESANELYGLEEVRNTIREIGQKHFSKGSEAPGGYGTYFFLQILGGLYEEAVAYLFAHSYVAAVHFAIALDFYGILRVADFSVSESELLTHTTRGQPQISFARMLGYYTRDFRAANVVAAVDYLTLINLNGKIEGEQGRAQSSICHEALRELVLETREFAQLLGDIRSDGTRIRGAIEQRLKLLSLADQEEFLRTVTLQAAKVADDNGRTTDAVLLYHLAEDYDTVIIIINRALSDTVAVDIGAEALRLQPLKPRAPLQPQAPEGSSLSLTAVDDPAVLAKNMITLYNSNALYYQKIRPANRETVGVLLRISEAKARVEAGQWAEALDIISALSFLPLAAHASIPIIRAHAQTLTTLPPTVARLAGPLLLWTMTCISRQRELLSADSGGGFESETRRLMREELVGKAKDLMVFAGLVKLRLGKGVWEGIVSGAGEVGVY